MGVILTTEPQLASVRRLVSFTLTTATLPDAVIEDDAYLGAAEAEVIRAVPGWEDLVEPDSSAIIRATTYLTASNILMTMPQVVSENYQNAHSYTMAERNINELIESYRRSATDILGPLSDNDAANDLQLFGKVAACHPNRYW